MLKLALTFESLLDILDSIGLVTSKHVIMIEIAYENGYLHLNPIYILRPSVIHCLQNGIKNRSVSTLSYLKHYIIRQYT